MIPTATHRRRQLIPPILIAAAVLLLTAGVPGIAIAQEQDEAQALTLTLNGAVELALKQNLDLQTAHIEAAIRQQDRAVAASALLPHAELDANDSVIRYNTKAQLGIQPAIIPHEVGPYQVVHAGPSFSTPIFDLTLIRQYQASGHPDRHGRRMARPAATAHHPPRAKVDEARRFPYSDRRRRSVLRRQFVSYCASQCELRRTAVRHTARDPRHRPAAHHGSTFRCDHGGHGEGTRKRGSFGALQHDAEHRRIYRHRRALDTALRSTTIPLGADRRIDNRLLRSLPAARAEVCILLHGSRKRPMVGAFARDWRSRRHHSPPGFPARLWRFLPGAGLRLARECGCAVLYEENNDFRTGRRTLTRSKKSRLSRHENSDVWQIAETSPCHGTAGNRLRNCTRQDQSIRTVSPTRLAVQILSECASQSEGEHHENRSHRRDRAYRI
jgi:hypothetical protein